MSPRFDAILFDLDGTLADSAGEIARALQRALDDLGLRPAAPVAALVDGSPLEEVFAVAAPDAPPALLVRFIERYRAHYDAAAHGLTRAYPGVVDALEALRLLSPRPRLAVATAKRSDIARGVCVALGIADHFDAIEGTGGTDIPPKPAPDLLLAIAGRWGVSPSRTLMVGDTTRDLAAGRAAGMRTAAVTWGLGGYDALKRAEPDHWLEEIEDILVLLGSPG